MLSVSKTVYMRFKAIYPKLYVIAQVKMVISLKPFDQMRLPQEGSPPSFSWLIGASMPTNARLPPLFNGFEVVLRRPTVAGCPALFRLRMLFLLRCL